MIRTRYAAIGLAVLLAIGLASRAHAGSRTIARCGAGFLEEVDGSKVLHVKGTPYEMGYQQGALLRDEIRELVRFLFEVKARGATLEIGGMKLLDPKRANPGIAATHKPFVPPRVFGELRRGAEGAGREGPGGAGAHFLPRAF